MAKQKIASILRKKIIPNQHLVIGNDLPNEVTPQIRQVHFNAHTAACT
jgi:hypothetical protein